MLTVSDQFPAFSLNRVVSLGANQDFQAFTQGNRPRPVVFFLLDFSFVFPAEVAALGQGEAR
jgi:hypothetical protein